MFYTGDQIVIFKVSKLVHAYICTKFCFSGLSSGESCGAIQIEFEQRQKYKAEI